MINSVSVRRVIDLADLFASKILRAVRRFAVDAEYRREFLWYHLPRPPGVFQLSGDTSEDRFPEIFQCVKDQLGDRAELRLLSFGCSTGEEASSLRRYFPRAAIDAIDVNPYRIRVARRQLRRQGGDPRRRFFVAGSTERLPDACYDAVFCMAVLRHGGLKFGPPPRCDYLIQFAGFEKVVADLARVLKPGGYLAIAFSNFRFADTASAAGFEPAMRFGSDHFDPQTPLFGPDDCLLPEAGCADVLFRKRLAGSPAAVAAEPVAEAICRA